MALTGGKRREPRPVSFDPNPFGAINVSIGDYLSYSGSVNVALVGSGCSIADLCDYSTLLGINSTIGSQSTYAIAMGTGVAIGTNCGYTMAAGQGTTVGNNSGRSTVLGAGFVSLGTDAPFTTMMGTSLALNNGAAQCTVMGNQCYVYDGSRGIVELGTVLVCGTNQVGNVLAGTSILLGSAGPTHNNNVAIGNGLNLGQLGPSNAIVGFTIIMDVGQVTNNDWFSFPDGLGGSIDIEIWITDPFVPFGPPRLVADARGAGNGGDICWVVQGVLSANSGYTMSSFYGTVNYTTFYNNFPVPGTAGNGWTILATSAQPNALLGDTSRNGYDADGTHRCSVIGTNNTLRPGTAYNVVIGDENLVAGQRTIVLGRMTSSSLVPKGTGDDCTLLGWGTIGNDCYLVQSMGPCNIGERSWAVLAARSDVGSDCWGVVALNDTRVSASNGLCVGVGSSNLIDTGCSNSSLLGTQITVAFQNNQSVMCGNRLTAGPDNGTAGHDIGIGSDIAFGRLTSDRAVVNVGYPSVVSFVDNDWAEYPDGSGGTIIVEFQVTNGYVPIQPGSYTADLRGVSTAPDIALNVVNPIITAHTTLVIAGWGGDDNLLNVTYRWPVSGPAGNGQVVTSHVAATPPFYGGTFSGGWFANGASYSTGIGNGIEVRGGSDRIIAIGDDCRVGDRNSRNIAMGSLIHLGNLSGDPYEGLAPGSRNIGIGFDIVVPIITERNAILGSNITFQLSSLTSKNVVAGFDLSFGGVGGYINSGCVLIGSDSTIDDWASFYCVVIGYNNQCHSGGDIIIGSSNTGNSRTGSSAEGSIIVGSGSTVGINADGSIIIGNNVTITAPFSGQNIAIGTGSGVATTSGVGIAIGPNAQATDNECIIGYADGVGAFHSAINTFAIRGLATGNVPLDTLRAVLTPAGAGETGLTLTYYDGATVSNKTLKASTLALLPANSLVIYVDP
jgi:hypothetical protein